MFGPYFKANPHMKKDWRKKCFAIAGDLTLKGLGLAPESRAILLNEVQIVINCAASVNFDDPVQEALNINYFGVKRLLDIAEQSKSI